MADQKVSDLPSLNGADVDPADLLYIIDSSAGSTGSKKIAVGQYQLAPVSGGTANGVVYLNGSKVVTTGSALVFDGTNLTTSGNLLVGTTATSSSGIGLGIANNFSVAEGSGASYLNIFRQNTSGATIIGNGYKYSGSVNGFASSVGTSWAKSAIALNGGNVIFYADTAATVANGTDVSPNERARITSGGKVYIAGTTDQGAYNLQVNGTGVWGAGAYVNGSDERLKDNIQTLNDGLAVVSQLRPVTFQYKPEHSKDQSIQPGFIAQELQQAMAGKDYVDGVVVQGPEYLNVAYQNLIPILTKAIQEQQSIIEDLRARVAALESA